MKTNDQPLLSYMYEAGYTEEDMFDVAEITKASKSIGFFIFKLRISAKRLINGFVNAFNQVKEIVKTSLSGIPKKVKYLDEYWEMPSHKNISIPSQIFETVFLYSIRY